MSFIIRRKNREGKNKKKLLAKQTIQKKHGRPSLPILKVSNYLERIDEEVKQYKIKKWGFIRNKHKKALPNSDLSKNTSGKSVLEANCVRNGWVSEPLYKPQGYQEQARVVSDDKTK